MKYYYLDEEVVAPNNDGNWVRREDHEAEMAKLRDVAQTDGPVYQAGRDEGRADVAAQLRAILDPDDLFHWNLDGVLRKVARLAAPGYCSAVMVDDLRARAEKAEAELAELKNRLCSRCHGTGWISESDGGGVCGCDVGDTLARAHAENNALRTRAEKAEANYRAMVAAGAETVMEIEMRVSAQRHTCGTCGRDTLPDGDCYGCEADRLHQRVLELEKHDQVCAEREKLQKALITIERSGVPGAIIVAARTDDHACGWCRGMVTPCPVEVARIALAWCGKEEK